VDYRTVGPTGLKVSIAGLGCNNFGMRIDGAMSTAVVHAALDAGITLFDTALSYGRGLSERFLGEALRGHRDEVVIATKFGGNANGEHRPPTESPGGRRWITHAVEESLRSLSTDRIDLYQLHFVDPVTPIEETLGALSRLVDQGKVLYVGCSNFAGWELVDARRVADIKGLPAFASIQNEWSLLRRDLEREVLGACRQLGTSILPYFPLASGMLTGRYRRGEPAPEGSRLSSEYFRQFSTDADFDRVEKLEAWSAERGRVVTEVALSWLAGHPEVASVIAGASRPEQVTENAAATRTDLSSEELGEISELMA
jgi:aryl-alcohol dehydrogenase-like predicted oxidoreductase